MPSEINTTPHPPGHPPMTLEILEDLRRAFWLIHRPYNETPPHLHGYECTKLLSTAVVQNYGQDVKAARLSVRHIETRTFWGLDWLQEHVIASSFGTIFPETVTMRQLEKNGYSFLGDLKLAYKYARTSALYPLLEGEDHA